MSGGRSFGGSSGVHVPGGAGGGVHVPGSVHVPGGGGGTSRMSGGMQGGGGIPPGVHLPSGMRTSSRPNTAAGQERSASSGRGYDEHASRGRSVTNATERRETTSRAVPHAGGRADPRAANRGGEEHDRQPRNDAGHERDAAGHDAGARNADAREHAMRPDPRIVGTRLIHTVGISDAHVLRAGPRAFLRPEEHRDIGRERDFIHAHEHDFHSRRVADFDRHEMGRWRAGLWRNEWHYGRRGWWWEVDGVWYDYPEPIWPYPEEVAPLVDFETPVVDGPDLTAAELGPTVLVPVYYPPGEAAPAQGPVAGPVIPPLPAAPIGWYRCDQPGGFYPGLDTCGTYWALVQNAPMPGE